MLILAIAITIAYGLRTLKPEPKQHQVQHQLPQITVQKVEQQTLSFNIYSHGTIKAKNQSQISVEIAGKINAISNKFLEGGFVQKGDVLLQIDNTEYAVTVANAEASLLEAQITLKDRKSRYANDTLTVKQAIALFNAAQKQLDKAKRDLTNTRIKAPFNGIISNKNVDIGQFVSRGEKLFRLSSTEKAEVRLPINAQNIKHLAPELFNSTINSLIKLSANIAQKRISRIADNARIEGNIDADTRVFYITAEIDDPYSLKPKNSNSPPLPAGLFVDAELSAQPIKKAVRIDRKLVSNDSKVYIYIDGHIKKQPISIGFHEKYHVIVTEGLSNGDLIVTSSLSIMYDGMPVEIAVKKNNQDETNISNNNQVQMLKIERPNE